MEYWNKRKTRNIGIMEYWNTGKKEKEKIERMQKMKGMVSVLCYLTQHSMIPSFQYSSVLSFHRLGD